MTTLLGNIRSKKADEYYKTESNSGGPWPMSNRFPQCPHCGERMTVSWDCCENLLTDLEYQAKVIEYRKKIREECEKWGMRSSVVDWLATAVRP
jgi:hypothetical protein